MSQGLGQVYVDVTAKATSATNSLNGLAKTLERVKTKLGDIDATNLKQLDGAFNGADKASAFAAGITEVTKALRSLSRIKTENLDNTITRLKTISGIDFSNLESLQGIDFSGFASAVRRMGSSSGDFVKKAKEVVEATKQVQTSTEETADAIVAIPMGSESAMDATKQSFLKLPPVISSVASKLGSLTLAVPASLASGMGDIANGIAMGIGRIGSAIVQALPKIAKFSASIARMGATKIAGGFKALGSELLKLGTGFSILNSKHGIFSKGLSGGFMTVMRYAFGIRSLFVLFNKLRNVITNGMKNLALQNAKVNQSVSLLMTSMNNLKGNLVAAVAPALNALAGPLSTLINMFADGAAKVAGFISALTGKNMMITATASAADYAGDLAKSAGGAGKGMGDAADNAKDLQKTLATMSFDELNQLQDMKDKNSDSGNGSGSGGGGGGTASSQITYEESEIPQSIKDFVNLIKQSWEEADFTYIGNMIGDKINEALQKIPWEKIQENSNKVGKSLATLLNGMINSELDGTPLSVQIGHTVAGAINTFLVGINGFVTNVKWGYVGRFITDGIKTALGDIEYDTMTENFKAIGFGIAAVMNKVLTPDTLGSIGTSLGTVMTGIIKGVKLSVKKADFEGWGTSIANGANTFFAAFDFALAGETFSNAARGLIRSINVAIREIDWEAVGYNVKSLISNIEWNKIFGEAWDVVKGLFKAVFDFAGAFGSDSDFAQTMLGIKNQITEAKNLIYEGDDKTKGADEFTTYLEKLAKDYEELASKGDLLTESEKAKLKFVTEELVGAVPELKKYYDEENGILKASKETIDQYVEAVKKKAIAEAQQDALKSYAKAQAEANVALAEAETNLKANEKAQADLKETLKDLYQQWKDGTITEQEYSDAQTEVARQTSELRTEHTKLQKTYDEAQETFDEADKKFNDIANSMGTYATETGKAALSTNILADNINNIPDHLRVKIETEGAESLELSDKLKVIASVTGVDISDLPHDERKIDDMYGEITQAMTEPGYVPKLDSFGNIRGLEVDKSVGTPTIESTGDITKTTTGKLSEAARSIPTIAGFISSTTSGLAAKYKEIGSVAKFTSSKNSLTTAGKTINTTANFTGRKDSISKKDHTLGGFTAGLSKATTSFSKTLGGFTAKIVEKKDEIPTWKKVLSGFVAKVKSTQHDALGAVYDKGQKYSIPQFASGGIPSHGTMFVAGEAGSEIVGTINGRTEVLNASQIASAIYSAVVSAMGSSLNTYLQPMIVSVKELMINCANAINTNLGFIDSSISNLRFNTSADDYFTTSSIESAMTSGIYKGFEMVRSQGFYGITKEEMEEAVTNGYAMAMAMAGQQNTQINVTGNIVAPDGRRLASYVMEGMQENNKLNGPVAVF